MFQAVWSQQRRCACKGDTTETMKNTARSYQTFIVLCAATAVLFHSVFGLPGYPFPPLLHSFPYYFLFVYAIFLSSLAFFFFVNLHYFISSLYVVLFAGVCTCSAPRIRCVRHCMAKSNTPLLCFIASSIAWPNHTMHSIVFGIA